MVHHKMPEIEQKLANSQDHLNVIRKMITQDKSYQEIIHEISLVRSELDNITEIAIQDLSEHEEQAVT
jgi:DNA-binding FrmR family transcriptional regulator